MPEPWLLSQTASGRQAVREPAHRTSERYDQSRTAYPEFFNQAAPRAFSLTFCITQRDDPLVTRPVRQLRMFVCRGCARYLLACLAAGTAASATEDDIDNRVEFDCIRCNAKLAVIEVKETDAGQGDRNCRLLELRCYGRPGSGRRCWGADVLYDLKVIIERGTGRSDLFCKVARGCDVTGFGISAIIVLPWSSAITR